MDGKEQEWALERGGRKGGRTQVCSHHLLHRCHHFISLVFHSSLASSLPRLVLSAPISLPARHHCISCSFAPLSPTSSRLFSHCLLLVIIICLALSLASCFIRHQLLFLLLELSSHLFHAPYLLQHLIQTASFSLTLLSRLASSNVSSSSPSPFHVHPQHPLPLFSSPSILYFIYYTI